MLLLFQSPWESAVAAFLAGKPHLNRINWPVEWKMEGHIAASHYSNVERHLEAQKWKARVQKRNWNTQIPTGASQQLSDVNCVWFRAPAHFFMAMMSLHGRSVSAFWWHVGHVGQRVNGYVFDPAIFFFVIQWILNTSHFRGMQERIFLAQKKFPQETLNELVDGLIMRIVGFVHNTMQVKQPSSSLGN